MSADLRQLNQIFQNIVNDTYFNNTFTYIQIQQLLDNFYRYCYVELHNKDIYTKQFHILYLVSHVLHKHNNEVLCLENNEFYESFYYPNIISILSSHLVNAKRLLSKIIKTTYIEIKSQSANVIDFYLVFFNRDANVIQNDVLNIFLNTLFLDNDPLDIEELKSFYTTSFRYLIYSYLKNKTTGLLSFEIDPSVIREDHIMAISTRYKIYEEGIRITQIQELCDQSNSYNRILQNYNKMKSAVITNELQKFYLYSINKSVTSDNKVSILSTFNLEDNLTNIKEHMPLIYKLLRALHINNKLNIFDDNFKKLLYTSVYEVLYSEFKINLSEEISINLANNISKKLTISLTNGQYIDPISMDAININNHTFILQLKNFLSLLIKNINN